MSDQLAIGLALLLILGCVSLGILLAFAFPFVLMWLDERSWK